MKLTESARMDFLWTIYCRADFGIITLPEINIAPETRPPQKETSIPTIFFQGQFASCREGRDEEFPGKSHISVCYGPCLPLGNLLKKHGPNCTGLTGSKIEGEYIDIPLLHQYLAIFFAQSGDSWMYPGPNVTLWEIPTISRPYNMYRCLLVLSSPRIPDLGSKFHLFTSKIDHLFLKKHPFGEPSLEKQSDHFGGNKLLFFISQMRRMYGIYLHLAQIYGINVDEYSIHSAHLGIIPN